MKITDLRTLLVHELKDIHSAETQLLHALPKMAKAAKHPELKQAFENHLNQTTEHLARIEKIFETLEYKPTGTTCAAMKGLVEEGRDMIAEDAPDNVKDAGLIASAQRVEHYEMAAYGCARAFARELGLDSIVETLTLTFDEEVAADRMLTEIAETAINASAVDG
ncbi:MAG: ferritin-like domain-containing protein [Phycisphaerae bacterium]|nr:ferritin-like domain-containing protein [Phycisphaerae bacterium]